MAVVLICGTAMAQLSSKALTMKARTSNNPVKGLMLNNQKDETPVWNCDFEGTQTWAFGNDAAEGVTNWSVVTVATYPTSLGELGQGWYLFPLNPGDTAYNETPEHWALVDYITPLINGGTQAMAEKAYIEFSDIDLTSTTSPKISFISTFRRLNSVHCYVKVSIDGGATWTDHEIFTEIPSNGNHEIYRREVLIPEAGGRNEVKVRFEMDYEKEQASNQMGYGWNLDDIKIFETAQNNLTAVYGRMSMFGYLDYRNIPENYWTNITDPQERRDYAYQIYDPYAQSPRQNWITSAGYGAFNIEVENNGAAAATPSVNVKVTAPSGTVIYDKTVTGTHALASTEGDTLDLATIDEENMSNSTIFWFDAETEEDIELGRYTVTYYVFEEGAEDADPSDNTIEQYFDITSNNYSKSYVEPTTSASVNNWTISASGDEFGTEFIYYYEPEDIMSADLFIDGRTTIGTSVQAVLYHIDEEGERIVARSSDIYEVTEEMLDTWTNLPFLNEYYLTFDDDNQYKQVILTAKVMWDNDDDDIYLGASDVLTTIGHNSYEFFSEYNDGTWYYGGDDIAITLHEGEGINVNAAEAEASNFSMYPNPSNGIVNFANVENATIEVYNMMGQVVATVNNASENASIDLSNVANGNYVVRIVKDGATSTSKLNIVR